MAENHVFPVRPLLPPQYFRAAGTVHSAEFYKGNPIRNLKGRGSTAAQRAGKRYEKKALDQLTHLYGDAVTLHPWIYFKNQKGDRFCQPDAFILKRKNLFIIEIKVRHTVDAYWQLAHLYAPVLRKLFPRHNVHLIEMTKSFDPDVLYPAPIIFSYEMDSFVRKNPPHDLIGVCQWSD